MKELTKIEIPEGGTLSIEHENEKCYAVIRGEDEPYWKKFERGDVVVTYRSSITDVAYWRPIERS